MQLICCCIFHGHNWLFHHIRRNQGLTTFYHQKSCHLLNVTIVFTTSSNFSSLIPSQTQTKISTLTQIHFNVKSLIITSCPGDRWLVQCLGCLYSSKGLFYRVVPADQGFHSSDEYAGIFRYSAIWGCVCVLCFVLCCVCVLCFLKILMLICFVKPYCLFQDKCLG